MRISPLTLVVVVACCSLANAWVPPSVPANSRSITSASLIRRYVTLDGKEIRGPLTPLGNFCLVKTKDTLSSSEGGILIPDQVSLCINVSGKIYSCTLHLTSFHHSQPFPPKHLLGTLPTHTQHPGQRTSDRRSNNCCWSWEAPPTYWDSDCQSSIDG